MAAKDVGETTRLHNLVGRLTYITSLRNKERKRGLHVPANIQVSGFASNCVEWFAGFMLITGIAISMPHLRNISCSSVLAAIYGSQNRTDHY